jgi:hypothetical protein
MLIRCKGKSTVISRAIRAGAKGAQAVRGFTLAVHMKDSSLYG